MNVDEFLEHYGVKGMHWGIRTRRETSSKPRLNRRTVSEDFKTASAVRKKPPQYLTNEEIKKANERATLESNYARLNPSKVEKGRKRAIKILATTGAVVTVYELQKKGHLSEILTKGASLLKEIP